MIKVMTIVGTRPEIIKLSEVIKILDLHTSHIIVHTGQNYDYELNEIFFEELDIRKPDYFLEAVKGTVSETIGDIIAKADSIIEKVKPDAILVYGDTNSCLSVIPAKKRKVPEEAVTSYSEECRAWYTFVGWVGNVFWSYFCFS